MSELKEGWREHFFTDILDIQGGSQPPKSKFVYEPQNGYIRLLQIRDFGEKPLPTYIPITRTIKTCLFDDILIARYGASIGRICSGMSGAYNVAMAKVIVPNTIDSKFVYYLLKSDIFQREILSIQRSAQDGFNKDDLSKIKIPLPPTIIEQKAIVEKLERLLTKLNSANERLDKIPTILKRFRQSVLSAACSGRLTADWHEGKELGEWEEKKLRDICTKFQYGTSKKSDKAGDVVVLRMGNLQYGAIDWSDLAFTSDDDDIRRFKLSKGDVLFNRTNSAEHVGKTSIYDGKIPAIFAGYLIKIHNKPVLNSYYLNYVLNSQYAKEYCQSVKTDGVNQSNINAQKLADFVIPLPPLPEQEEIVRRVDALFALADKIEEHYKTAKQSLARAEKALYAKAFSGEL